MSLDEQETKELFEQLSQEEPFEENTKLMPYTIGISNADDYEVIKKELAAMYPAPAISFIFLIDTQNDIGYIYKAKGNVKTIRQTILPAVLKPYELMTETTTFFSEINDVRDAVLVIDSLN